VLEALRGYLVLADRLVQGDASAVGAWNFGPNRENEVDVGALAEAIRRRWGEGGPTVIIEPSAVREAHYLKLDIAKADAGLGWRPLLGFAETVALTTDWYRAYAADASRARRLVDEQIEAYTARI
jgi:CDP-glucose 4,6-dehydratase